MLLRNMKANIKRKELKLWHIAVSGGLEWAEHGEWLLVLVINLVDYLTNIMCMYTSMK